MLRCKLLCHTWSTRLPEEAPYPYHLYFQESDWAGNALTALLISGTIVSYLPQVGSYLLLTCRAFIDRPQLGPANYSFWHLD